MGFLMLAVSVTVAALLYSWYSIGKKGEQKKWEKKWDCSMWGQDISAKMRLNEKKGMESIKQIVSIQSRLISLAVQIYQILQS